ncbi:MAG: hypothetical protein HUU22_10230 [Phycisphaerae bacterium]|nr:hypothetical protein [Phycisphaerae bacterium]NUQ46400.1 hypothetical protein [Phycisphaerae bacterium]
MTAPPCPVGDELDQRLAELADRGGGFQPRGAVFVPQMGLLTVEDDGSFVVGANGFDLTAQSLRFVRDGATQFLATREAPAYDADLGTLVAEWTDWGEHAQALAFSFPFGDQTYDTLYATSRFALFFASQPADPTNGNNPSYVQFSQSELLADATPRIIPLGRKHRWIWGDRVDLYVRTDATSATFTWRQRTSRPLSITNIEHDVQLRLDADGQILISYHEFPSHNTFGALAIVPPGFVGAPVTDASSLTATPTVVDGPLLEAFRFGALDVYAVWDAVRGPYGFTDQNLDAVAMYQNFFTDITFYAGAYHANGRPGVSGIGNGGSRRVSLLHMNQINLSWNRNDELSHSVLSHEFGHRWLYFISGVGASRSGAHPAMCAHLPAPFDVILPDASSAMGGTLWTDNGDGTFTSPPQQTYYAYSWNELYLMGLADPAEVEPWWYVGGNSGLTGPYWPPVDTTYSGTRVDLTISHIIDANGPRVPAYPNTQRDFEVLFVLIGRPLNPVTPADVADVHQTMEYWHASWADAVGQRASVEPNLYRFAAPGDIDGNGALDSQDVSLFVEVLLGLDTDEAHVTRADMDRSGTADGDDVGLFLLSHG